MGPRLRSGCGFGSGEQTTKDVLANSGFSDVKARFSLCAAAAGDKRRYDR